MRVLLIDANMIGRWEEMRIELWPDATIQAHRKEMKDCLANPERYVAFLCEDDAGVSAGFAEVALRIDYVNGCETSPVAFLEGIFVTPSHRRRGVAQALVTAVERWAMSRGCSELASDTDLSNLASQSLHLQLGFAETERVVYFRKELNDAGKGT